jgi:iron-sulfur cluster repair protein YtfE (RIC family)
MAAGQMIHPPLKRHESLQPLSRDHYVGLVQAQHLIRAADADLDTRRQVVAEFLAACSGEIGEHFDDEEDLLAPCIPDLMLLEQLCREHRTLRAMAVRLRETASNPDGAFMQRVGQALHDHVRWEERELFPAIEATCPAEKLEYLLVQTEKIEKRRRRGRGACNVD